jgi:hypothetical protein
MERGVNKVWGGLREIGWAASLVWQGGGMVAGLRA